ncbi:hypothetical protein [Microvirga sesbaniae]|jgi:hypothetical protein|uniref:hypothetical protein n=1 Tax=Microvirga sesbaniae TaxID=681392 RepID=UPI0021C95220|nr:hypothetical protein [Microvirga sp. HBU67692]
MKCTSALIALAAIAFVIIPVQAEAQPRVQRVGLSGPLVLRVRPSSSFGRLPLYLVGSTYEPRNPFDPIELAPPLGPSANNIAITLPISSASCRFTRINGTLFASPGCLGQ